MGGNSETSGVPRHDKSCHCHLCQAPGGSSDEQDATEQPERARCRSSTLAYLIEAIRQIRKDSSRE